MYLKVHRCSAFPHRKGSRTPYRAPYRFACRRACRARISGRTPLVTTPHDVCKLACPTASHTQGAYNPPKLLVILTLLLLNGSNKDKEVIAPIFKIRRLGLRPLEALIF